jgi:hypothetical protein
MGMFDYVKCSAPLPGEPPAFVGPGHRFQTKDLDCTLSEYEITADGRLVLAGTIWGKGSPPEPIEFHGVLDFYDSNCRGCSDRFTFTSHGEDGESVDYRATFDHGQLVAIVETGRTREPALPVAEMDRGMRQPTAAEITAEKVRQAEDLAGRAMFLLWGGMEIDSGEDVMVVADGGCQWAIRKADGQLEIVQRWQRDRILFDSREDAMRARDGGEAKLKRRRDRYAALMAEREKAKGDRP